MDGQLLGNNNIMSKVFVLATKMCSNHCFFLLSLLFILVTANSPWPVNVKLAQESQTSLRVTWEHSCEGPPDIHYSISYMFVQTGMAFTIRQETITVDRMDTSITITNLLLIPGSIHIVVVSSVSDHASAASELAQLAIRKLHASTLNCIPKNYLSSTIILI